MQCINCGIKMQLIKLKQCYDNTTIIQLNGKCLCCGREYHSDEFEDEKDFDSLLFDA